MHERSRKQPIAEAVDNQASPVRIATDGPSRAETDIVAKDPIAAELGRRGGRKGGRARALSLTPEQRREIARRAAAARWQRLAAESGGEPAPRPRLGGTEQAAARGTIELAGHRLDGFVMEDGTQLIGLMSVTAALGELEPSLLDPAAVRTFRLPGDWRLMRAVPADHLVETCRRLLAGAGVPVAGAAERRARTALAMLAGMALRGLEPLIATAAVPLEAAEPVA